MSSAATQNPPQRALIVDDGAVNQKLLTALLCRQGYAVAVADNGQQALELLADQEFDVVLMDVQMPVMDGLTATRLIRQREAGTSMRTPIVAVTAGGDPQSCLEAGMDEFLAKPVQAESLREKIERVLSHRQ